MPVTIDLDTAPWTVDVPDDLAAVLDADPPLRAIFDGLAFSHQKEYVTWIVEAKREETRRRRIEQAATMLREGTRTPKG